MNQNLLPLNFQIFQIFNELFRFKSAVSLTFAQFVTYAEIYFAGKSKPSFIKISSVSERNKQFGPGD